MDWWDAAGAAVAALVAISVFNTLRNIERQSERQTTTLLDIELQVSQIAKQQHSDRQESDGANYEIKQIVELLGRIAFHLERGA